MYAKVVVHAPERERHWLLAPGRLLVIGRSADCDISVAATTVSRRHATLAVVDGSLHVADLGSSHGLTLDGRRIAEARLRPGETVHLGTVALRLVGWEPPTAVAAAPTVAAALAEWGVAPWPANAAPAPVRPEAPAPRPTPAVAPDAVSPAAAQPVATGGAAELAAGDVLGGYRILGQLGAGGYATVYRAEQIQLGREVALKVLRADGDQAGPDAVAAFLREARAAAALADPRLVQVFDLGEDRGQRFLSMELLRGGSLADAMRRDGPVPWRALLPILRDVAGALQVAHKAGLVHRDVKPANILLTDQRRAKLADLGLVRAAGGAGDRVGTAAYMAPEQLTDAPVDGRADVYALGCTVWHALTGAPPFQGTVKEILRRKRTEALPSLPPRLGVPAAFERLLRERLLAVDPAERLGGAGEVLDELDRIERISVAVARRPLAATQTPRGGSGGKIWLVLVALLVVGAIAVAIWQRREGG